MSRGDRSPTVSLVIATYNWPAPLDRVLASTLAQTSPPEQVLIADDGFLQEREKALQEALSLIEEQPENAESSETDLDTEVSEGEVENHRPTKHSSGKSKLSVKVRRIRLIF